MTLGNYMEANKERIIACWKERVTQRLAIQMEESELVNDLPDFLDDVVTAFRHEGRAWPPVDGAQSHGRQRIRTGTDIGSLVEEMFLILEVVVELAKADGRELGCDEVVGLSKAIARGTGASANAYTAVRDEELAKQAQKHFSFVAHELRTPLHKAQLAVHVLEQALAGAQAKPVDRLRRALSQVIGLVDNSLVEVRLSGKPDVNLQRVGTRELVEMVRDELQGHLEDKDLELHTEVEQLEFEADEKLVVSALTNLVRNAIKFTPSGRCIRVRACERAGRAVFEVEDECGGMPEDVPARLFQPFVQTSPDKTGHGLGLMIVKQAAEAHGGSVHINNQPPKGCVFVLKVPLTQPDSE